jgi:predicted MFS family arabinose efflux permease
MAFFEKNANSPMTSMNPEYRNEFYELILSSITIFLASETARPLLPLYVTSMGASFVELGIIIGVMSISLILTKVPLGILAEKANGKIVIVSCGIAQSICQISYSFIPSLIWFLPIRILHAISIAPLVPLAIRKTQEYAPIGKTGETLGVFLTSYGVANTMGPFLCSLLLTRFTYVQVFQILSILPLIGILPLVSGARFPFLSNVETNLKSQVSSAFSHIRHSRNLTVLTALRIVFAFANGLFVTYFIVYAEESIHLAPFIIMFLLGVRGAADMSLRIPVGKVVDHVDTKYFIVLGFGIVSIVYYLLSEIEDLFLLALLMIFYGIALSFRVVSDWTIVAGNSPDGCRSVIAAYLSTMYNVGSAAGEIFGGVFATFLAIPDLFKLSSLLMIVGVLAASLLRNKDDTLCVVRRKVDYDN